jgi:hypothetical protein
MRRILPLLALSPFALFAMSMHRPHPHPRPHPHVPPRPVLEHMHDAHCQHVLVRGRWIHLGEHEHGERCAHRLLNGIWLLPD